MIYAYDLLVNLAEEVYDFYDWKESDSLSHIRRVPLFKIEDKVYLDFMFKKIRVDEEFLFVIKDKTQVFAPKSLEITPYAAVFTNGENALMLEFDSQGFVKKKSKFLVNEEMEIVELSQKMKEIIIKYNIISKKSETNKLTRDEKDILNSILDELSLIKEDEERIDYLYYEWFNKSDGINKYDALVKSLKSEYTPKHLDFLETLKILTKERKNV